MLTRKEFREIVRVGILLTTEKDRGRLLSNIISTGMELTNCDGGTLYMYNGDSLEFNIMKIISKGVSRGEKDDVIGLPHIGMKEENVCAYSAIHRELVNIEDAYCSDRYNFEGTRAYDKLNGYRTKSMLVVPMVDMDDNIIGVIQLVNAMDDEGSIVPFSEDMEFVLRSLGSQAAVSVSNMMYMEEVKCQMHSFVDAFAMAVDKRTPYNGSHTRKVTRYAIMIADMINRLHREGKEEEYFDENRKEQLELAASVHDIGKMVVPLEIMNKATRLDGRDAVIEERYKLLDAYYEIDFLKGRITEDEFRDRHNELKNILTFIRNIDGQGVLREDIIDRVHDISKKVYITQSGESIRYLTEYETECLSIRKGTLTDKERIEMENHVVMTKTILDKVHFNSHYSNVNKYASTHHEYLDGTGYPMGLKADELELESRILTVVDIYDALTSADRPYKKPITPGRSFESLHNMADEGKIDGHLVNILQRAVCQEGQAD